MSRLIFVNTFLMLPNFAFANPIQARYSESHLLSSLTRLHRYLNEFICFSVVPSIMIVTGTFSLLLATPITSVFVCWSSITFSYTHTIMYPPVSIAFPRYLQPLPWRMDILYCWRLCLLSSILRIQLLLSFQDGCIMNTGRATVQSPVSLLFWCWTIRWRRG